MTAFFFSFWLAFLLVTPAPEQFILVDETGQMDSAVIQAAAEPLMARGARVAVFVVPGEVSFDVLLAEHGLMEGRQLLPEVIAIKIDASDNTTEIRYGATWRRIVGRHAASVYEDRLAAGVMTGAYNAGVVNAFNEILDIAKNDGETSPNSLPDVSRTVALILGIGIVLVSVLAWVFVRPHSPHEIHLS